MMHLGDEAIAEVAGLRNRCPRQRVPEGALMKAVFELDATTGDFTFKAGIMGVVWRGGAVRPGDAIDVELPTGPHRPLERV